MTTYSRAEEARRQNIKAVLIFALRRPITRTVAVRGGLTIVPGRPVEVIDTDGTHWRLGGTGRLIRV